MALRRHDVRIGIGLALAMLAGPVPAEPQPGGGFEVTRYDLALTPDLASGTVAGRETITLNATADGVRRLEFSGNALSIDQARIDGVVIPAAHRADRLDFDLARPLAKGRKVELVIAYHGKPARGLLTSKSGLYASYFACDWMVCQEDSFGDKADFSLDLTVPQGMDTLSIGRMIGKRPGPGGREIHSWRAPRPYSAYLFSFAVGHFTRVEDRVGPLSLTYMSDAVDAADLKARFAETGEMVRFFEDRSGLTLPVDTYSQLLVTGDEAQEAASYSTLGLDNVPVRPGDPAKDWAIAHELAHQWWGNLITCASLRDFWLNEGVTTFMTAAWKEHRYGAAAYRGELDTARSRLEKARALGFDKPLSWDGVYPNLEARRAVQYSKGALFLDHLRTVLGEEVFWSGLRQYSRAHAGKTVTSMDFERAMETASGRDLHAEFATWVFGGDS